MFLGHFEKHRAIFLQGFDKPQITVKMQWGRVMNCNFQIQQFRQTRQIPVSFSSEEPLPGILQPLNFEAHEFSQKNTDEKLERFQKLCRFYDQI